MINLHHEHVTGLETNQQLLAVHLIVVHDMQDIPGWLLRAPLDDVRALHHTEHARPDPARGLFQWIRPGF